MAKRNYPDALEIRSFSLGFNAGYLPEDLSDFNPVSYNLGLRAYHFHQTILEKFRNVSGQFVLVIYNPVTVENYFKEISTSLKGLKSIRRRTSTDELEALISKLEKDYNLERKRHNKNKRRFLKLFQPKK